MDNLDKKILSAGGSGVVFEYATYALPCPGVKNRGRKNFAVKKRSRK
jgi:hypothetical protein